MGSGGMNSNHDHVHEWLCVLDMHAWPQAGKSTEDEGKKIASFACFCSFVLLYYCCAVTSKSRAGDANERH